MRRLPHPDRWQRTVVACVEQLDDGHEVGSATGETSRSYTPFERHAYEEACNLFKKEVE